MSTNFTDMAFDEGQQINVVSKDGLTTWVTTALSFDERGVFLEYHEGAPVNADYRLFLPWSSVDRIYQEL